MSQHPASPSTDTPLGRVWLIGAGPGAADLITVRGARLLAEADVVLHDALVTEDMLALCPQAIKIGVMNEEAHTLAQSHGLLSVMDRCLKIEHAELLGSLH